MPFIEYVGVPSSGKTEKAKQFLKRNLKSLPGRRSLNHDINNKNFFFLSILLNSDFSKIFKFFYKIFFVSIKFYFAFINCSFLDKLKSLIVLNQLLWKSALMSSSEKLYVLDQGLQQFVLASLAKEIISLRDAKRFSKIFKNTHWAPYKYIFLFIEEDEMRIRIKNSKKHQSFLKKSKIKKYFEAYISASILLFFDKKPKKSYEFLVHD